MYVYIYTHANRANYSTRYKRYKNKEKNSRYRNDTYLENNKKKTLLINKRSSEDNNPITKDNKSIQIQVKKTGIKFTSQRS